MKPTDADRDPAFDRFVARGLERETDASGGACPDADLLAAWFDRSLSSLEVERIEAHSATCGSCQQVLADLARSEPEVTRAAPVPTPDKPWHWHWRWAVPLATAAIVVVVGTRTLRAPGDVSIPSAPRAALGDRPATGVDLRQQAAPEQSGTVTATPAMPTGEATRPAEPRTAPRKEGEMAKAQAPAIDRLAQSAPIMAPVAEPPPPVTAAGADASARPGLTAAKSAVTAVPPAPAAPPARRADEVGLVGGIARERSVEARPGSVAESIAVRDQALPAAAAAGGSARLAGSIRETAVPMQVTSAVAPSDHLVTWRYGPSGVIERSADGGQTWERQRSGVTSALADASAPTDRVCWIVGARGVVLRTTDGSTWVRVPSPTMADLVSVHAWNETNATITAADRAEYVTTDGGASWRKR